MASKPTIVFVPGAWHSPDGYAAVIAGLQEAGYPTLSVALPSVGAEKPLQSFDEDVKAIRHAIKATLAKDQDVVVVHHSYGGVPVSQAVEGLGKGGKDTGGKGGVVRLFYLASFILPVGASLMDALGSNDLPWWDVQGDFVYPIDPDKIFYNDMSEAKQKQWIAGLRSFCYRMFYSKLSYAGYKDIPSTYLLCTQDQAIPIEVQKAMVQGAGVPIETEEIDASHSPFLSKPKAVIDAIKRAAGEKV